jgi:hypothetical protein
LESEFDIADLDQDAMALDVADETTSETSTDEDEGEVDDTENNE